MTLLQRVAQLHVCANNVESATKHGREARKALAAGWLAVRDEIPASRWRSAVERFDADGWVHEDRHDFRLALAQLVVWVEGWSTRPKLGGWVAMRERDHTFVYVRHELCDDVVAFEAPPMPEGWDTEYDDEEWLHVLDTEEWLHVLDTALAVAGVSVYAPVGPDFDPDPGNEWRASLPALATSAVQAWASRCAARGNR